MAASAFPPIGDYAFLSDCETTALVAPSGNVEWMYVPRMDSPSLFRAMLDRDAGMFSLAPSEARVPAGQRYIRGTNILETTWGTKTGWLIVRDVLLVGPWRHDRERSRVRDSTFMLWALYTLGFDVEADDFFHFIAEAWLVSALSEIGEHQRARDLCERLLSYASPLQLYGEELDPLSGRHLGNFPQAFTHLALINAAMHVIRNDQRLSFEQQPPDATRRER
jgi:GH15 family glucan-1,4-alpha-glucosidase